MSVLKANPLFSEIDATVDQHSNAYYNYFVLSYLGDNYGLENTNCRN